MSTGILSDVLAGFLLIVDLVVSDSFLIVDWAGFLLIVDLVIWFLDFWGKKEKGISPPFLFRVSICRLVCLMLVGMYHL